MKVAAVAAAALLGGCATAWQPQGSFYRTEQTRLAVQSTPPGEVCVNGRHVGTTPATIALQYGREIERQTRKVSHYRAVPGWATFYTIATFGFYVPFGCAATDIETTFTPRDAFKENVFAIEIKADGFEPWKQQVVCKGEETQNSVAILNKK